MISPVSAEGQEMDELAALIEPPEFDLVLLLFTIWEGATWGGQWGPAQRLRSDASD